VSAFHFGVMRKACLAGFKPLKWHGLTMEVISVRLPATPIRKDRKEPFMTRGCAEAPTILVAEDDEGTQLLVSRAFKKAESRCQLRFVGNGEEAVFYLQGNTRFGNRQDFPFPSLVLLDIKMPRRNGFEVLQWIRKERGAHEMIVVVFSTSEEQSEIDRAFASGANSYLVKSPLYSELTELVRGMDQYWFKHNRLPSPCERMFRQD
jgi:CheY-like chemotaxis protein